MNREQHKNNMKEVYSDNKMSSIVGADGNHGFMNLGYDPIDGEIRTEKEKQLLMVCKIIEQLQCKNGQTVIDFGCGKGGAISVLKTKYPEVKAYGVNIDPLQIQEAIHFLESKNITDGVTFLEHDLESNGPLGIKADRIMGIEFLSHISDKMKFMDKLKEVLTEDGQAVFAFSCLKKNFEQYDTLQKEFMQNIATYFRENPEDFLTIEEYVNLFKKAGFQIIEAKSVGVHVYPHRHQRFIEVYTELTQNDDLEKRKEAERYWRENEKCDVEYLKTFLHDNIQMDQSELYDYAILSIKR